MYSTHNIIEMNDIILKCEGCDSLDINLKCVLYDCSNCVDLNYVPVSEVMTNTCLICGCDDIIHFKYCYGCNQCNCQTERFGDLWMEKHPHYMRRWRVLAAEHNAKRDAYLATKAANHL